MLSNLSCSKCSGDLHEHFGNNTIPMVICEKCGSLFFINVTLEKPKQPNGAFE